MFARPTPVTLIGLCLIGGCASSAPVPPGQSLANSTLQSDTLRQIKRVEMARMLNGEAGVTQFGMPTVVSARVEQPPTAADPGTWREVWTIQRANGTVEYAIKFVTRPDIGGTDMVITPLNMPAPNPAS